MVVYRNIIHKYAVKLQMRMNCVGEFNQARKSNTENKKDG